MMSKNVPQNIDLVVSGSKAELEKLEKFGLVFDTQSEKFKVCLLGGKWILFEVSEA